MEVCGVQGVDEVYATHLMLRTDQPFFAAARKGDLYTAQSAQKVGGCACGVGGGALSPHCCSRSHPCVCAAPQCTFSAVHMCVCVSERRQRGAHHVQPTSVHCLGSVHLLPGSCGACRMPEGRRRLRKSRFFGPKDSAARLRTPSTTTRT